MMDQVELLEGHVETLLKLLESAKAKIGEMARENDQLKLQVENAAELSRENVRLESQVQELESELESHASKESQIRDRLKTILTKIDTIENEMTSAE